MREELRRSLSAIARWWALVALVLLQTSVALADAPGPVADLPDSAAELVRPAPPESYRVRKDGWLEIAYPEQLSHWVEPLRQEAQTFRTYAQEQLGQPVLEHAYVRLAPSPRAMRELAPTGAGYPSYAAGVAYSKLDLILLTEEPVTPNADHDLRAVLRHELAHLALADAVQGRPVPLWFNEGLAVVLSREDSFGRLQALWTATVSDNLLPLSSLEAHFPKDSLQVPLAYAQAGDVVRFLSRKQDAARFALLIARVRRGQSFEAAMSDAYGVLPRELEVAWRDDVERRYTLLPVLLSGSLLWAVAIGLMGLAWYKKRRKQALTLRRWAVEEAREEARIARLAWLESAPDWVRQRLQETRPPPALQERVPTVEHQGDWHTLH